jgi:hypothetical protein
VVVCLGGFVVVVVCLGGFVVVVVVAGGGKKKIGDVVVVVVCLGGFVVVVFPDPVDVFPAGMIGNTAVSGAVWTLGAVELVVFLAAVFAEALVFGPAVVGVVVGLPVVEVAGGGGMTTGAGGVVDLVTSPLVDCDEEPGS